MVALIETLHAIVRDGFSWAAVIGAILAWYKWKSSRQLKRDIADIKKGLGLSVVNEISLKSSGNRLYKSLQVDSLYVQFARLRMHQELIIYLNRRMTMLKKIGSSKLQMILVPTIINICLLIGYVFDIQDIQSKVESWTPLINLFVQAVLGIAYAFIEGAIDKAAVKVNVEVKNADFETPIEPRV